MAALTDAYGAGSGVGRGCMLLRRTIVSGAPSPPQCSVDGDCDQSLLVLRSEVPASERVLRASEFCGDEQCQIESCDSDADCTH